MGVIGNSNASIKISKFYRIKQIGPKLTSIVASYAICFSLFSSTTLSYVVKKAIPIMRTVSCGIEF